jgi:sugar lactone lactonase YvrE
MIVATGLAFGEGPRWHDGALWWSDMHGGEVSRLANGEIKKVCDVPGRPSGLGWLPDGRMLVVSMTDRRLLRLEPDGALVAHADLSALAPRRCNDLTVDRLGRAYVGNFGFELDGAEEPRPTVLIKVDPDGSASVVADDLLFPNGAVITEDARTLIIAETWGARLTAFDIEEDGGLSNRRVWAQFDDGSVPDGICLDAEGAIWIASPTTKRCLRVSEGGEIVDRVETGRGAFACVLGDDDRRTLYVCTADSHNPERQRRERNGRIEAFRVNTPGAAPP